MKNYGIESADVPAFIEQVPNGAVEVERLTREGYIYF
jgi:intracellular sulfur oxidation DsrE/DsrF family protein